MTISLTTHDLGNVVGPKDYLLAARLSNLYTDNKYSYYKNRASIPTLSGILFLLIGYGIFEFFYNTRNTYRITSRDFILSDVNGYKKIMYKNTYSKGEIEKGVLSSNNL